jgi:crotonobetainyl-CoA:carnitine CoA-transferase CaiB-like acyl-CoA transferase
MQKILEGVRVLELGQVLAGPFAGAMLADLGAEVVKLERIEGGDDARHMGPAFRNGDALNFHVFNRGKQSVAIDLKSAEGLAAFERLAGDSDILVHNLRPGVTESMGIDGPSLCARHPRLVYCAISAFGHLGPMARQPGYEPLIQAFSGLSSLNGGPDDPPMRSGVSLCDQGTGMWAVIGALALLERRHRTGRGGVVQASLLETALAWNAQKADAFVNQGELPVRHRSGHPGFVPYEAFDTADLPILICCGNDRLFAKLAHELQRPGWAQDRALRHQPRPAAAQGRAPRAAGALAARATARRVDRAPQCRRRALLAGAHRARSAGPPAGAGAGHAAAHAGPGLQPHGAPALVRRRAPHPPRSRAAPGRTQPPLRARAPAGASPCLTCQPASTCTRKARARDSRSSRVPSPPPTRCA